jgi:valyl-tRNA synthetase
VITDATLVQMDMGTGAVKVTPAHDANDWECGKRHGLEMLNIFTDDGRINEHGGARFAGQTRFEARANIIAELTKLDLYRGKVNNPMTLQICSRSKDVLEPVLRPQWYVSCGNMAKRALDAVDEKKLTIVPSSEEATWRSWLATPQDWCISRQLWWGHRIPAYQVRFADETQWIDDDAHWFVGHSEAEAREQASMKSVVVEIRRDECVLDTWFSSALLPFSAMGWPQQQQQQASDLRDFFPNTMLETGCDILFFWVARMVMLSLELTDQLPFHTVLLHPMVRDKHGEKMSKTSGNVIDPLDVVDGATLEVLAAKLEAGNLPRDKLAAALALQKQWYPKGLPQCGADALRFGLLAYTRQSKHMSISLDIQVIVAQRHFCDKLWQAMRFLLLHLEGTDMTTASVEDGSSSSSTLADAWILHRLHTTIAATEAAFLAYDLGSAAAIVRDFWLDDLCDVYLELVKPRLRNNNNNNKSSLEAWRSRQVLLECFSIGLRLLHPLMPFVTEELYHKLPGVESETSIMVQPYPTPSLSQHWDVPSHDTTMALARAIAHASRSMRASLQLTHQKVTMYIVCDNPNEQTLVQTCADDVAIMAQASQVHILPTRKNLPLGCMTLVVSPTVELHVPLVGLVDLEPELIKMENTQTLVLRRLAKLQGVMQNVEADKMPEVVRAKHMAQIAVDEQEAVKLRDAIVNLKSVLTPEQREHYLTTKTHALIAAREKAIAVVAQLSDQATKTPSKKAITRFEDARCQLAGILEQLSSCTPC